jgi:hypothetical protein
MIYNVKAASRKPTRESVLSSRRRSGTLRRLRVLPPFHPPRAMATFVLLLLIPMSLLTT